MRAKLIASGQQSLAQLGEVVNFAVEDHPNRAVLVADRLAPRSQVDDREPPHSQRDVLFEIEAFVVRPAMNDGRRHPTRNLFIRRPCLFSIDESENAAHFTSSGLASFSWLE